VAERARNREPGTKFCASSPASIPRRRATYADGFASATPIRGASEGHKLASMRRGARALQSAALTLLSNAFRNPLKRRGLNECARSVTGSGVGLAKSLHQLS
jgi:hypothetical protein